MTRSAEEEGGTKGQWKERAIDLDRLIADWRGDKREDEIPTHHYKRQRRKRQRKEGALRVLTNLG